MKQHPSFDNLRFFYDLSAARSDDKNCSPSHRKPGLQNTISQALGVSSAWRWMERLDSLGIPPQETTLLRTEARHLFA